ncbi:M23 family metallopeptidase [Bacillus sp. AGMB 02131]|uniref:M23 family metallopeptidase n=1 Tax=Peribacillus faecalis TaxID=2772559 RepID=A0A927HC02_9BACI|nr:M23 family metallopeptidase [Peribacillus faecalis]MBD3109056.1 M23 family metallopeptidase [Peribacillus faecalis]
MRAFISICLFLIALLFSIDSIEAQSATQPYQQRMDMYKAIEQYYHIPWYYMAAIDQYEHSLRNARKDLPDSKGPIGIIIPPNKWNGMLNPNLIDTVPERIAYFDGLGKDGNSDGKADVNNDEDILVTMGSYLSQFGTDDDHIRLALWNYYKRDKTVGMIMGNAKLFKKYKTINLNDKSFPVPLTVNYSYRSTWGVARGWGGRRSHEGTDIFADYGVPVRSTCYGIIEIKGWNRYGGWRIGIRDINNTYHYFAHLGSFAKGLKIGQIVEPGMIIGTVGSSGYGPPGTSGKFPPHLHFGMYKDNGYIEWSFDPYYHLSVWERNDRKKSSR